MPFRSRASGSARGGNAHVEPLERRTFLDGAPVVAAVAVGGSDWSGDFLHYLHDAGLGEGGYEVANSTGKKPTLQSLPWTNVNQVKFRFSEAVVVEQSDLRVEGLVVPEYAVASFNYDPETLTATWTLAAPIANPDRVTLTLSGGDSASLSQLDLNFTPGDVNDDGRVNAVDLVLVRNRVGRSVSQPGAGTTAYSFAADLDGSGRINASDLVLVRNRISQTLPEVAEWINPAGGAWENPANWKSGVLPGPNDHVLIDVPGDAVVTLGSNETVRSLRTNSPFTLRQAVLEVTDGLHVNDVFTLDAGTIANTRITGSSAGSIIAQGNVKLSDTTLGVDMTLQPAGVLTIVRSLTFTNNATLTIKGRMTFQSNMAALHGVGTIRLDDGNLLVDITLDIDAGVTLRGSGAVAAVDPLPNSVIRHQGPIVADQPGKTLQVSRNKALGAGALRAESGATLELGYDGFLDHGLVDLDGLSKITRDGPESKVLVTGSIVNSGGTTVLGDAYGSWEINGASVDDGAIAGFGGSPLVIRGVTLSDVRLATNANILPGGRITVTRGLALDADVTLTLAAATADEESAFAFFSSPSSPLPVKGAGTIKLETGDAGPARLFGHTQFTIGPNVTVRGAVNAELGVIVEGTLLADLPGRTMSFTSIVNKGVVQVSSDSVLAAGQSFSNQGTLDIRPGGVVNVGKDFTAASASTVRISLTGVAPAPARYGRLNIGGQAAFAGALVFDSDENYLSTPGDVLTIVTFAQHSRPFDSIRGEVLDDGHVLNVRYTVAGVAAEVTVV